MSIFPANCWWCGHASHETECPRTITVGKGKAATEQPCPCARQEAGNGSD